VNGAGAAKQTTREVGGKGMGSCQPSVFIDFRGVSTLRRMGQMNETIPQPDPNHHSLALSSF
jgi:hypothetical protein